MKSIVWVRTEIKCFFITYVNFSFRQALIGEDLLSAPQIDGPLAPQNDGKFGFYIQIEEY